MHFLFIALDSIHVIKHLHRREENVSSSAQPKSSCVWLIRSYFLIDHLPVERAEFCAEMTNIRLFSHSSIASQTKIVLKQSKIRYKQSLEVT